MRAKDLKINSVINIRPVLKSLKKRVMIMDTNSETMTVYEVGSTIPPSMKGPRIDYLVVENTDNLLVLKLVNKLTIII